MAFLDQIFSPRLDGLEKAMSLASRRESLLNNNLANVNTPGFKRKDIDFNISLDQAMGNSNSDFNSRLQELKQMRAQQASDQTSIRFDGNNVDMEREVMSIAQTQLRFQALTTATSDYFSGLKNAIREGR